MAGELNVALGTTGLTVTAKLYLAGTLVGTAISCPEVSPAYYSGSVPSGTAAGTYVIIFSVGSTQVAGGTLIWNGVSEGSDASTVNGFSAGALLALRQTLTGVVLSVTGPVMPDAYGNPTIMLTVGDDYSSTDQRSLSFDLDGTQLPDLTPATTELHLQTNQSIVIVPGTISVQTGTVRTVTFAPTAALTSLLIPTTDGRFTVMIFVNGRTITPLEARGVLTVLPRIISS